MKLNSLFVFVVFISLLHSCKQKDNGLKISNYQLAYTKYPVPNDSSRSCSFSASIPIIEASNQVLVDSINAFIEQTFFSKINPQNLSLKEKIQAQADSFYVSYLNDFSAFGTSDFPLTYQFDLKLNIAFHNNKYVTLKNENYDYMGGAHGNYSTLYHVFNTENGKLLTISDITSDTLKLFSEAEKIFFAKKNLNPKTPINDQGYWFEKNKFKLNNNFGIINDTLIFTFNPYEITSYSEGQTEIKLPLNLIKQNF